MIADAVKSRAIALALGDGPLEEDPQAAYNIELLHNDVLELLTRRREENAEPLAPLELVRLSTAVARLVAAQAKAAEGAAKPAAEPGAATAADAPREKGLSAERVAELQEKVAGVHVERERQPANERARRHDRPHAAAALADADFAATEARDLRVNPLERGVFMLHQRQWLKNQITAVETVPRRGAAPASPSRRRGTIRSSPRRRARPAATTASTSATPKEKGFEYIGYVRHFARCIGEPVNEIGRGISVRGQARRRRDALHHRLPRALWPRFPE